jgi:hypothetical protein
VNKLIGRHAFLGALGDLALIPMHIGNLRKLCHFQMPIKAFHYLCDDIYNRLQDIEFTGMVGNFYMQDHAYTSISVDILIGKQKYIDKWNELWIDLVYDKISLNDYHTKIGLLFGYSHKAIKKYLADDPIYQFPNQYMLDYMDENCLKGYDMCHFTKITKDLCENVEDKIICGDLNDTLYKEMDTVEKSIVRNDIKDKMLMETEMKSYE